jgi:hypothetical protein
LIAEDINATRGQNQGAGAGCQNQDLSIGPGQMAGGDQAG